MTGNVNTRTKISVTIFKTINNMKVFAIETMTGFLEKLSPNIIKAPKRPNMAVLAPADKPAVKAKLPKFPNMPETKKMIANRQWPNNSSTYWPMKYKVIPFINMWVKPIWINIGVISRQYWPARINGLYLAPNWTRVMGFSVPPITDIKANTMTITPRSRYVTYGLSRKYSWILPSGWL